MASYEITWSCGHTTSKQLVGPGRERQSYIDWAGRAGICPACKAADNATAHAKAAAEAAEVNTAAGLPALQGSPKQVAWAETIRAKALAKPVPGVATDAAMIADAAVKAGIPAEDMQRRLALIVAATDDARAELEGQTSAKWWIDHRDDAELLVSKAFAAAREHAFADFLSRRQAEREAREAAASAAQAELLEAERQEREERWAQGIAAASTFVVADRPAAVTVRGDDIIIQGSDGRTARGQIDDGDWYVHQIGDHIVDSTHAEAARIAAEAKAAWNRAA